MATFSGFAEIYAKIDNSFQSDFMSATVSDRQVGITGINERTFGSDKFNAVEGSTSTLKLDLTLEDNNYFSNALNYGWASMEDNLNFESDHSSISVNSDG